jgi:hypothetical protein
MLQFAPAGPEEKDIRAKLARLGIGAGKTFDFKALSPEQKAALVEGTKEGEAKVTQAAENLGKDINGWKVSSPFGDRAFFHGDWLLRAAGAKVGIYGNDSVEATYPMTKTLADGEALDCSKHNYTLIFAKDQFPPVKAFWSVTMYDGKTQLLIENPINRYLINSPMLPDLKENPDGSLTLYIQKDSPGKNKESNWLPAPDGPIYLVMRLYWPKTEPPSILPAGERHLEASGHRESRLTTEDSTFPLHYHRSARVRGVCPHVNRLGARRGLESQTVRRRAREARAEPVERTARDYLSSGSQSERAGFRRDLRQLLHPAGLAVLTCCFAATCKI